MAKLRGCRIGIQRARDAMGWTQENLVFESQQCEGLRLSRSVVQKAERGREKCNPSTLLRIAELLGVDDDDVVHPDDLDGGRCL